MAVRPALFFTTEVSYGTQEKQKGYARKAQEIKELQSLQRRYKVVTCTRPQYVYTISSGLEPMLLPCGMCMACKIRKTGEWTIRLENELGYYNDSCFLTLTYAPEFLPGDLGLEPRELQKFIKRLRKNIFPKIKYYACGEYGDQNDRPHYHLLIFGWYPENVRWTHNDKQGRPRYASTLVDKLWPYGGNNVGVVEHDSIQYVCGYIRKKLYGVKADSVYGKREPPFARMSRGIGERYVKDHADEIKENLSVTSKGKNVGLPRYYRRKLDITTEQLLEASNERNGIMLAQLKRNGIEGWRVNKSIAADRRQREANLKAKAKLFGRDK